jgi:chromosome segregation ATPase
VEPLDAYSSDDHEDEEMDALAPLPKKDPVLPVRSRSPSRSPVTKKKSPGAPISPTSEDGAPAHPIKQELMRFSDIWKTQAEDEESPQKRESLNVGRISAAIGELNGEIKEEGGDPYGNEYLDAKLRSTEQKLHDSEAKVEELIIAKNEIQKEVNEEQLRNDELGRRLLELEDKVEDLEQEKKELEDNPKVIEHEADPIELFELQQEINTLKTEMSIKVDQHNEAVHSKNETIKELEAKLGAGGPQQRESLHSSMHSTVSTGSDAKTQGLLLRSNDRIQKQEAEIRELKQKLEELGNAEIIEEKDEEIKNLGVQMFELETKMKNMEAEQQKALKQKEETIVFFQNQVVEMQKKMPKQAAYTRKESTEPGEEGTATLGGEGAEEGGGLWGVISRASPGLLGGRQTVDRRRVREVAPSPKL